MDEARIQLIVKDTMQQQQLGILAAAAANANEIANESRCVIMDVIDEVMERTQEYTKESHGKILSTSRTSNTANKSCTSRRKTSERYRKTSL